MIGQRDPVLRDLTRPADIYIYKTSPGGLFDDVLPHYTFPDAPVLIHSGDGAVCPPHRVLLQYLEEFILVAAAAPGGLLLAAAPLTQRAAQRSAPVRHGRPLGMNQQLGTRLSLRTLPHRLRTPRTLTIPSPGSEICCTYGMIQAVSASAVMCV